MKLNLHFFPISASNSADKLLYFQEARDLYKLITCSAKLSLPAAERGKKVCNTHFSIVFTV